MSEHYEDGDEEITHEWLAAIAVQRKYVWDIPGTRFFLYEHASGPHRHYWSITETAADTNEFTYCYVATRGELLRMVNLLRGIDDETKHKG